jgi:hypothetical protein
MGKKKTATKAAPRLAVAPLDKNDPRVRAVVAEILGDAFKKSEMKWAAERAARAEKTAAEREAERNVRLAARETQEKKEAKKRKSHKSIVSRLGRMAEPLEAIHDIAELALAQDDHETALVVASSLSMLCLKRLEDCLNDMGDVERESANAWLAGEAW